MTDFACGHGDEHLLLGVVVVGADLLVVKEGEQLLSMTPQALDEPLSIGIVEGGIDELIEAFMKFRFAAGVRLRVPQFESA